MVCFLLLGRSVSQTGIREEGAGLSRRILGRRDCRYREVTWLPARYGEGERAGTLWPGAAFLPPARWEH